MEEPLFRKAATAAARHRWFSPVLIVTPPSTLPTVVVALIATSCLAVAMIVIEVPERVRATGVLLPSQGLLKVRARRSGWVEKLRIGNGATVVQGQALLWLSDVERAPERQPESVAILASLQNELRLFEQSIDLETAAIDARRMLRHRRARLLQRRLTAATIEHQTRLRQFELQNGRAARAAVLAADGLYAAQSADELAVAALQAKAASQSAWQRLLTLQDELLLLEQQSLADTESIDLLRSQARVRRESLLRDISEGELRSVAEITAPGDGIVAGLAVRRGSFVQSGQTIMTLHNPIDSLEARLYVSANNAAMIDVGQRVELQLRAYPRQLFGTQSAQITSISAVALSMHELDATIPVQGPVFEIRAALDSTNIIARGSEWHLPPGTTLIADLVRRRWPLYRWLLRSGATADELGA